MAEPLYTVSSLKNGVAVLIAEADHLLVEVPSALIPPSASKPGSVVSLQIRHEPEAETERAERRASLQELVKESVEDLNTIQIGPSQWPRP